MKRYVLLLFAIMTITVFTACNTETISVNPSTNSARDKDNEQPVEAFGCVTAPIINEIYLPISAQIEKVLVKEGQKVKYGDNLLLLDLSEYIEQIKIKDFEIQTLTNEIQYAASVLSRERAYLKDYNHPDIIKLLNDIANAELQHQNFLNQLSAKKELYFQGIIPKNDYEIYENNIIENNNRIEELKLSLEAYKLRKADDLDSYTAKLKQDKIKLNKLSYELDILKKKLASELFKGNSVVCNVKNGIILDLQCKTGSNVSPNSKLLGIADLDSLIIEAQVDEQFIAQIKAGATVSIVSSSNNEKVLKGKVSYISNCATLKNGETTIPVQITIDTKDTPLVINSSVEVKIFPLR